MEKKERFDGANFPEKRSLAIQLVESIQGLDPPGRFLRKIDAKTKLDDAERSRIILSPEGDLPGWIELTNEQAIHKACQIMRDISRPDRAERDERRRLKKLKQAPPPPPPCEPEIEMEQKDDEEEDVVGKDLYASFPLLGADPSVEPAASEAVQEAVAAAEEAMDRALEAVHAEVEEHDDLEPDL